MGLQDRRMIQDLIDKVAQGAQGMHSDGLIRETLMKGLSPHVPRMCPGPA